MADVLEGARGPGNPVKFRDMGDGSWAEILAADGNTEGALLAEASYAGVQTALLTNHDSRGLLVYLNVVTPGTGALALQVFDSRNGFVVADFTGVGVDTSYCVYPGAVEGVATGSMKVAGVPIPRSVSVRVNPSDGSTWVYSAFYSLIV